MKSIVSQVKNALKETHKRRHTHNKSNNMAKGKKSKHHKKGSSRGGFLSSLTKFGGSEISPIKELNKQHWLIKGAVAVGLGIVGSALAQRYAPTHTQAGMLIGEFAGGGPEGLIVAEVAKMALPSLGPSAINNLRGQTAQQPQQYISGGSL